MNNFASINNIGYLKLQNQFVFIALKLKFVIDQIDIHKNNARHSVLYDVCRDRDAQSFNVCFAASEMLSELPTECESSETYF